MFSESDDSDLDFDSQNNKRVKMSTTFSDTLTNGGKFSSISRKVKLSMSTCQKSYSSRILSANKKRFHKISSDLCTPRSGPAPMTGSINKTNSTPNVESSVIVALIEGRGCAKGEIGLATFDFKNPVLNLYQFTDSQTYTRLIAKLNVLNPLQVILPNTVCEMEQSSAILHLISESCVHLRITSVNRKYFNDQKGIQSVRKLCLQDNLSIEFQLKSKYYCLAATNALLKYIEYIQNIDFAPKSLKIVFSGNDDTAVLDFTTVKNMELIKNTISSKSPNSLYGILNNTKTQMGSRLLRSNIIQPLSDIQTLNDRHTLVEEFLNNSNLYHKVRYTVGKFPDLERILSMLIQIPKVETLRTAENKVFIIILLKDTLESVDDLRDALQCSKCSILKSFYDVLCDEKFNLMLEKILTIVDSKTHHAKGAFANKVQKGFAIKSDINGLLDISRRTYSEAVDDIDQLVKQLGEKYNLVLKSGYSASRGFFLKVFANNKKPDELPQEFLKPVKCKNSYIFTTYELMSFNERVRDSLNEIFLLSGKIAETMLHEIRMDVLCLYNLSGCVAILDMMSCFAFNCINFPTKQVKPEFTNTLAIKNGHHPILAKMIPGSSVPNNVYASDDCNFTIIGGPNMSGKSTYLSKIVLLQIMAQIGSFVPAESACFRIAGQIFTRIGIDLDIGIDISNFMSEMKETNYILQNANSSSLIIIDELGRGTSTKESISLCHAISEYLLHKKAFTFFVTHYKELTLISELYPNVENYYFNIIPGASHGDDDDNHIDYTHLLAKGTMIDFHYGIHLAKVSTIPASLPIEASQICAEIDNRKKKCFELPEEGQRKTLLKLYKQLEIIFNNGYSEDELKKSLIDLKAKCIMK